MAIADAFDAMTTDRPYRPAMSLLEARAILQQGKGTQWDPELAQLFLELPVSQRLHHSLERLRRKAA